MRKNKKRQQKQFFFRTRSRNGKSQKQEEPEATHDGDDRHAFWRVKVLIYVHQKDKRKNGVFKNSWCKLMIYIHFDGSTL